MAESRDTKYTVAKLNNSNYQVWQFKMKMLLIRDDTWTVIRHERPDDPVPNEWVRKDDKAQCTISLTVEDNQLIYICNCTSAKDMWKELQKVHERSNLSSKMYLRKKLYKTKLQSNQTMQEYISSTLRLVEQLRGVDEEVTDQQMATLLLCGLPNEYDTLTTALEAREEDDLTLEYVKNKLVDTYKRKKENETDSAEFKTESALYSTSGKPNYMKSNHGSQHKERDTRSCFICKKLGHLKKDCRVWKARTEQENRQSNSRHKAKSAVTTEEDDGTYHGCFTVGIDQITSDWFIDSGATTHVTNNLNFFTVLDQTKTDRIYVANGTSVNAAGIGEGYLDCILDDDRICRIKVANVLYAPALTESLLSVKKLASKYNKVEFSEDKCFIKNGESVLAVGKLENNLYKLLCRNIKETANVANLKVKHQNCIHTWHRRLGIETPML